MHDEQTDSTPVEVAPGIWVLPMPMPVRAEPVNAYLLRDEDGSITVFDTGLAPGARSRWARALTAIGARPDNVRQIVVSHYHPDHLGGARALHELTGAPVLGSRRTVVQSFDVWGDAGRIDAYFGELREHLLRHGMPTAAGPLLDAEFAVARSGVSLPPEQAWQVLDDGDHIEAAGRTWRVRMTPGHADGHLVLHASQDGLLLAGDHLLERISPAVGQFPRHEGDPLGRYLESLMLVAMLQPTLVLPGHGMPFGDGSARARALVSHHAERLQGCLDPLAGGASLTAYEVAMQLFGRSQMGADGDLQQRHFEVTETLAHLERARAQQRVGRVERDGLVRFHLR